MFLLILSLVVFFSFQVAVAEEHLPATAAKPTTLMSGLGQHHHPIATTNSEAQRFFDQGFALVYGFNHDEAVRSFQRAAELDPQAVMPLWGIALALGPNINLDVDPAREKAAYEAVQKVLTLATQAPENERAYITALAKRYSIDAKADLKKLTVDYKNAMGELVKRYPDDLDAATLYAESAMDLRPWQLWSLAGKPAPGTQEIVAVLESVLARDPYHPGANHYYIHVMEASPYPERALPSAERLNTLVPAAGHLVHMPAHIYMRTGDYAAAAKSNTAAAEHVLWPQPPLPLRGPCNARPIRGRETSGRPIGGTYCGGGQRDADGRVLSFYPDFGASPLSALERYPASSRARSEPADYQSDMAFRPWGRLRRNRR